MLRHVNYLISKQKLQNDRYPHRTALYKDGALDESSVGHGVGRL